MSYFLVPAGAGVTVEPTWDALGMRATGSHDLHLDVTVPTDALLGGVEGLTLPLAQVMPHWLVASYAAVYVGVARSALEAASRHLRDRGLTQLPAARARIGRADAEVAAARLAVAEAARRVDADPAALDTRRWVWRAKLLAGTTAARVTASMVEAAGTSVTRRGHALERLFRDARCGALQPASVRRLRRLAGGGRAGRRSGTEYGSPPMVNTAHITGFGIALPDPATRTRCGTGFSPATSPRSRLAGRLFRGAEVRRRHAVVNPVLEDASTWSTGTRMRRYEQEALLRSVRRRCRAALADSGLSPGEVGLFAVASCTGYTTPGFGHPVVRRVRPARRCRGW